MTGNQSKYRRAWWHWGRYLVLACLVAWLAGPGLAITPTGPAAIQGPVAESEVNWLERGQQLYEAGNYNQAVAALNQAIQQAETAGRLGEQVTALRNLALIYQQLGQWQQARQALTQGLGLLQRLEASQRPPLQAALLTVQGSLQLEQGQAREAATTWEQASTLYSQLGEPLKTIQHQINQAQALQRLGFHRRASEILTPIVKSLTPQEATLQTVALRYLGESRQALGEQVAARDLLEASLETAQTLADPVAIAQAQLSLANISQAQGKSREALQLYQQITANSANSGLQVQAQLNQITLLLEIGQPDQAAPLVAPVQAGLQTLPPGHTRLFGQINLAQSLLRLKRSPQTIAPLLATTMQQARDLGDQQAESYAVGLLGQLYETSGQPREARQLTQQALTLALNNQAPEIAYRWHWQLGRLLKAQADREAKPSLYQEAIAAYSEAMNALQGLRGELASANTQVQLSFQDNVEPIHREFISLLLDPRRGQTNPQELEKALNLVESLQLAELDNFFREACLRAVPTQIDRVDQQAAMIYPILLADRLEVIVSLPNQPLRHYTSRVSQAELERMLGQLRQSLVLRIGKRYLPSVQKLYDWIIRPVAADLATSQTKTLVFVLDGALRNLPMAVLHDGKQFLIEQYSIALTPGLQLLSPKPLQDRRLSILTAALSESRQGFSALPNVLSEVKEIQSAVPGKTLLNQSFTQSTLQQALGNQPAPIVHLATHGQFSSSKENTFVLTWDDRLDITTLTNLLQVSDLSQAGPIELLVLSACETAVGDRLAALGMAGMAVRAGARSTIASLWQINDEATALLMNHFYDYLANGKNTRAEALRQAQLKVLAEPRFRQHPYFWAPYVLVGNWL